MSSCRERGVEESRGGRVLRFGKEEPVKMEDAA